MVHAALAGFGVVGLVAVYAFDPAKPGVYPVCPFFGLTGCHCPGCGTLRALHQLLHGDLISAAKYNLFVVLALPFIAYSFISGTLRAFQLPAPTPIYVPHQVIWALLMAILTFWVLRNVPVGPFTVLAP